MLSYTYITKEIIQKHKSNWPGILVHTCRALTIEGSGSGKTNVLLYPVMNK